MVAGFQAVEAAAEDGAHDFFEVFLLLRCVPGVQEEVLQRVVRCRRLCVGLLLRSGDRFRCWRFLASSERRLALMYVGHGLWKFQGAMNGAERSGPGRECLDVLNGPGWQVVKDFLALILGLLLLVLLTLGLLGGSRCLDLLRLLGSFLLLRDLQWVANNHEPEVAEGLEMVSVVRRVLGEDREERAHQRGHSELVRHVEGPKCGPPDSLAVSRHFRAVRS